MKTIINFDDLGAKKETALLKSAEKELQKNRHGVNPFTGRNG